MLANKNFFKTV